MPLSEQCPAWGHGARLLALVALVIGLPPLPLAAQPLAGAATEEYAACMEGARRAPDQTLATAQAWIVRGGGAPAEHCAAVVLIGLGRYVEAAQALERLAGQFQDGDAAVRAGLLAQVGQAWLMAGEVERAAAAQSAALAATPDNVELMVDRSIALASLGRYWEAVDDLNRAEDLAPDRPDILVLRASAYRHLDALELAEADVDRALALDAGNPEALLERGLLRQAAGDPEGARRTWQQVLAAAEDSPAAVAAREHLQRLDASGTQAD